ncbi:MAG TPA: 30S ribosomal protein S20 [Candidatus Rifleibacterium sp.]|nr:30S ribosomal protein S20 [Candidatus Rifleibacterium sp.]HPT45949.1 30S ribosomal protein S20 [Candidatus Rifleibacterium sp.]
MANTKSAAKNARKATRRHVQRVAVKSELKTLRKKAIVAAETKKPATEVAEATQEAIKKFAKAASNKIIHQKTASRKISRLVKAVNRLQK